MFIVYNNAAAWWFAAKAEFKPKIGRIFDADIMASDREVLRQVWEGKLPVCFSLAEEDLQGLQTPDPFYLMVPRLSYFPLVTDKVIVCHLHIYSQIFIILQCSCKLKTCPTRGYNVFQCALIENHENNLHEWHALTETLYIYWYYFTFFTPLFLRPSKNFPLHKLEFIIKFVQSKYFSRIRVSRFFQSIELLVKKLVFYQHLPFILKAAQIFPQTGKRLWDVGSLLGISRRRCKPNPGQLCALTDRVVRVALALPRCSRSKKFNPQTKAVPLFPALGCCA